ncbi:copper resistance protein CopC [uncultured Mycobacterium sp.]|uniref:copper resistance CopC family protein n=1 Tax=uncultured Mycobacterium sp. TaxID=171292 RepID=UPI0035CBD6E5
MAGALRAVTVSLALAAMLCVGAWHAQPAAAHAVRVSADPPENAVLTVGPARVSATFNEPMQSTFAAMTVVGPDGNLWSSGQPQVAGAVVSVGLRPLGPAGTYTVNYRVTSADGHVVSGSWSFRLAVSGTGEPGPPAYPGDTSSGTVPAWPFAVGAVVVVAGGALWAARRRR